MANSIVDNRTPVDAADAITNWDDLTGSAVAAGALDTSTFIEGSGSITLSLSNSRAGRLFDAGSAQDWSSNTFYVWFNSGTVGLQEIQANGGTTIRFCGATVTDWFEVYVGGSDVWPASIEGGWAQFVVDIEEARARAIAGNLGGTNGTVPATSAIRYVGVTGLLTIMPKMADNFWVDAIWRLPSGSPGIIVDGTNGGGSTPWNFQDMVNELATSDGIAINTDAAAIRLNTPIQIGNNVSGEVTDFLSLNEIVLWADSPFAAEDFYSISFLGETGAGSTNFQIGAKTGSGASATGAAGSTIAADRNGKQRWTIDAETDANFDSCELYGATLIHMGDSLLDDSLVEIISTTFSDCGTLELTTNATAASMARLLNNVFGACPGPRAQVEIQNAVSPSADGFNGNVFANMNWFGVDIGRGVGAGGLTFELRDNSFTGNGANRDILASHEEGTLTINSSAGTLPQGTNGTAFVLTMVGSVDKFIFAVCTYEDADALDTDDEGASGNPLVTQTTASLSADDDTFAVAAAEPFGALTYTGGSDQYTDDILYDRDVAVGLVARLGLDEVTPGAATRTGFPVHDGTEAAAVQMIVNVNEDTASTPVAKIDPAWRPWQVVDAGSAVTFTYGAGSAAGNANRMTFVVVVAIDDTTAANTAVSTIVLNRDGSNTTSLNNRADSSPQQDDNIGASGNSLELTVFDLDDNDADSDMDQGTLTIQNTVTVTTTGVTEGASVTVEAAAGGDLAEDTVIGDFPKTADANGEAAASHSYTNPQPINIRARYAGSCLAAIQEDNSGAPDFADFTAESNDDTADNVILMPATEALDDAFYAGMLTTWSKAKFTIASGQGRAGTWSVTWEYWTGSVWSSLSNVVDGTDSFANEGVTTVTWDIPGDWAAENRSSEGSPTTTALFFVRARISSFTSAGGGPTATKLSGNPTRYRSFTGSASIESTGVTVPAVWIEDTIIT